MKKKIAIAVVAAIVIFALVFANAGTSVTTDQEAEQETEETAEEQKEDSESEEESEEETVEPEEETIITEVSPDNILWSMWEEDGYVYFSYENGSDYPVCSVEIYFTQKSSVTEDTLETVFYDWMMDEWMDLSYGDLDSLVMYVSCDGVVDPGEESSPVKPTINSRAVDTVSISNLYEASYMGISYIVDGSIYEAAFDLSSGDVYYEEDDEGEMASDSVYEWSESELSEMIPVPSGEIVGLTYDLDNTLHGYVYGVDEEYFNEYVEECIEMGFTLIDYRTDTRYKAFTEDMQHSVLVCYTEESGLVQIYLSEGDYSSLANTVDGVLQENVLESEQ